MSYENKFIKKCVFELENLTEKDKPYTRLVFSKHFKEARKWLVDQFNILDLEVRIDDAGNLIGSYKSKNDSRKKILIGSHLDTVPSGGRFDGIAGIVSSLSILKNFREKKIDFPFDIELYDYLGEELNDWSISCVGTRGMTGLLDEEILNRMDSTGRILKDEINKVGGNSKKLIKKFSLFQDVIACFELHIEQGISLQNNKIDIGIVKSIPNISRHRINIKGQAGHSGTTLMNDRKDALLYASSLIIFINKLANQLSKKDNRHFVATVGKINNFPNSATIISDSVELIVDLRVVNLHSREEFLKNLKAEITNLNKTNNILIEMIQIAYSPYVEMSKEINKILEKSAKQNNISFIHMDSGAGHDTAHLSRVAPASMIFIPCKDGLSHCPEEYAKVCDIDKGSKVIQNAILGIAEKIEGH